MPRHANSRVGGVRLLFGLPDARDIGLDGSVPITWRERRVFDCLRLLPEQRAAALIDRALQRRWITVSDLVDRIQRETNRRHLSTIVGHMRTVVDGTQPAAGRLATDLLRRAGIKGWADRAAVHLAGPHRASRPRGAQIRAALGRRRDVALVRLP